VYQQMRRKKTRRFFENASRRENSFRGSMLGHYTTTVVHNPASTCAHSTPILVSSNITWWRVRPTHAELLLEPTPSPWSPMEIRKSSDIRPLARSSPTPICPIFQSLSLASCNIVCFQKRHPEAPSRRDTLHGTSQVPSTIK